MMIDEAFRTSDISEAEAMTRRVYPRADLRESVGDFDYQQVARGSDGVTFTRFKINSQMDIAVDFEGVAAFGILLGGRYALTSNGRRLDPSQPFLFTPGPGTSQSEGLDVLMINVDAAVLARSAAQRRGMEDARLAFAGGAPVSNTMRTHWLRTVNYAWNSVIQVKDVFQNAAIRRATLETVVTTALATFPIDVAEAARASDFTASSAVRRAVAFIDDNADQPLTAAQIGEAARLSVRALQLGFQRELGLTPMGYLREVRLEAARADLLADGGGGFVADVAHRWAFANLGRFAAQYRARFGENPVDTLRR